MENMKNSVACVGNGFVGGSLTQVLAERGFDVYVFDKAGKCAPGGRVPTIPETRYHPTSVKAHVMACSEIAGFTGVYFVCVPTPMNEDGSADVSIVESVLEELASQPGERIAVVKSTVPPGSTKRWNERFSKDGLQIVFSPEFLRESSALDDMRNQDRIVLGGPKKAVNKVRDVFRAAFPNVPIHKTSSTNAEFVKYTGNCFLSVKVSFANELYQVVSKFDPEEADYDRIVELASLDKRLGDSHWKVPGPMPADDGTGQLLPGFAGSCFIKDINALIYLANELGVDPKVMRGAWEKNLEVRPQRDWERLVGRAVSKKR
jgi:UDPglucose 6-dehydrogenase